jgi:probable rRNA maturation factor
LSQRQTGRKLPTEPLRRLMRRARERLGGDRRPLEITLVGDEEIRALNRRYLGRDRATNVISFDSPEPDRLGEIIVNVDHAAREAEAAQESVLYLVGFYAIHGLLHLAGYDHERSGPDEAARMERAQQEMQDLLDELSGSGKSR